MKPVYFELKGFGLYDGDSNNPTSVKEAGMAERRMIDLGRVVNELANTDHQEVHFFPLTTSDGKKGFFDASKKGARIGYCFDPRNGRAYLAFSGEMDAEIARKTLEAQGYDTKEIERIPGIVSAGETGNRAERLARDIGERRYIEESGFNERNRKYTLQMNRLKNGDLKPKTSAETMRIKIMTRKGEIPVVDGERSLAEIALKEQGWL